MIPVTTANTVDRYAFGQVAQEGWRFARGSVDESSFGSPVGLLSLITVGGALGIIVFIAIMLLRKSGRR